MRRGTVLLLSLVAAVAQAQERIRDVIYLKQAGCAYTLDVFKPKTPNHKAVVWMVSGGWFSSHQDIREDLAKAFTDRGFTFFQVVHGSQPKYTIMEIVPMVRRAIRFVRANATTYGIDPQAIGVCGGSAGGHLSLEIAGLGDDGNPAATDPVEQASSRVNAVVAFYPPTDFLNWGAPGVTPIMAKGMEIFTPAFGVTAQTTDEEKKKIGYTVSPIILINPKYPPTLLIHGDADTLVPVQQSKLMDAALEKAGITHKLVIIPGGGHDGITVLKGAKDAFDWFDTYLKTGK